MCEHRRRRRVRWPLSVAIAASLAFASVDASAAIPVAEREALIALYDSTNGASWQSNTNWLGAPGTECSWYGVHCDQGQTAVTELGLTWNGLSGTIPAELGGLTSLEKLGLGLNELSGPIPPELGNLTVLEELQLGPSQVSGPIPASLGNLTNLKHLVLSSNQLSGSIPPELGNLTNLDLLDLRQNQLSGAIPPELGNLTALAIGLFLSENHLSGAIPPELGNLTHLTGLTLFSNQLSGPIPPELGNLTALQELYMAGNQLSGPIPDSVLNLPNLFSWGFDLRDLNWNALHSSSTSQIAFLASGKQASGDWQSTQTIAPTDLAVVAASPTAANLSWTPIAYIGDTGGYRVLSSATSGGPYTLATTTANKSATAATVSGLIPGEPRFFVVETFTNPHAQNQNTVVSERTPEVSVTTPCPSCSSLSIDDVAVTEGDSGTTTVSFTVSLSAVSGQTVTVDYATSNDTATAGSDYVAASGTLTFAPGVTMQPLPVTVNGDTLGEPNERFLVTLSNPAYGVLYRARGLGTIVGDDGLGGPGSAMPVELSHGFTQRRSLAALPGPAQEQHYLLLEQKPYSSYELVVDEVSGALQSLPDQPLAVDLLATDGTTVVLESRNASPLGHSRSLRWANRGAAAIVDQWIRIRSGGCTTECGAEDQYRLRCYETTYAIPRFNNTGSQRTVLTLQNPTTEAVDGTVYFWSGSGTLVASQAFTIASGATLALDTTTVPGAAGQSGSLTIANDSPYGALAGKAATLDPATGFSFDSPMVARPR